MLGKLLTQTLIIDKSWFILSVNGDVVFKKKPIRPFGASSSQLKRFSEPLSWP